MNYWSLLLIATFSALVTYDAESMARQPTLEVMLAEDIKWKPLNPARGNKGPQAGTLWGDQTKEGPSGFLVKFVDGFASPPHIHNITYRGVVLGGLLHNDDPAARAMWMAAGSYWTQPAGEVHITSSLGASLAYVETNQGPYLVMPPDEAFSKGEKPVNIDASNIVWLDSASTRWVQPSAADKREPGPEVAFLWGVAKKKQQNGAFIKLPKSFHGKLASDASILRCIVVKGVLQLEMSDNSESKVLAMGSYFGSKGASEHTFTVDQETIVYVRSNGTFEVIE